MDIGMEVSLMPGEKAEDFIIEYFDRDELKKLLKK